MAASFWRWFAAFVLGVIVWFLIAALGGVITLALTGKSRRTYGHVAWIAGDYSSCIAAPCLLFHSASGWQEVVRYRLVRTCQLAEGCRAWCSRWRHLSCAAISGFYSADRWVEPRGCRRLTRVDRG